jgi:colanic acid biosynthesis glycosyl transferase WcaI
LNILLLSQYYYPEERTAPTNLHNFSIDLTNKGHSVTVLTSVPNHPYGSYYKGYKLKILQSEYINGIEVIRLPIYPDHSMSMFKRTLMYLSFLISATLIGPFALKNKKIDLILTYFPPLTVSIPAKILSLIKGAPILIWMTDLWPENLISAGKNINQLTLLLIKKFEFWSYNISNKITVNTPGFIPNLLNKNIDSKKIDIISDYADPQFFFIDKYKLSLAKKHNLVKTFNIVYAGNLGEVQGIKHLILAAKLLQEKTKVHLVLIGDGTELNNLKLLVSNEGVKNISFITKKPMSKISQYLALADVLVLHLIANDVFKMQMPSKLIAYMASSKPILCAFEGVAGDVVKNANCGLTCKSSDENDISSKMMQFYKMDKEALIKMGSNGYTEYKNKYTREIQSAKLDSIIGNILKNAK